MRTHHLARQLAGIGVAAAVAAGSLLAVASPAQAVPTVRYLRIHNVQSGMVAHVPSAWNGAQVVQMWWGGYTTDRWLQNPVNGGLAVQFQNDFNSQCLTVGGNLLDNAPVVQMPCDANNVLQWWFLVNEPAYSAWHMRSFMGFYLAIPNGTGQGAPLLQTRFSYSPSQLWRTW